MTSTLCLLWLRLLASSDLHGFVSGAPLLGGYVAIERAENPKRVLLLDGGDLFTGTLEADLGEGAAVVKAMNALGYDAAAVGNHDFDFGPKGPRATPASASDDPRGALKERMREARFPLLTANLVEADGQPLKGARRFAIVTVAGVKIGVVGGTTEALFATTMRPNLVGLRLEPLAPALASAAAEARKAGAQLVIGVVHAGAECAPPTAALDGPQPPSCTDEGELLPLARALDGKVDALVGGHTHKSVAAVIGHVPVIQAGAHGEWLDALSLEVDDRTHAPTGHFRVEPPVHVEAGASYHGKKVAPDARVQAAIAGDLREAAQRRALPVGATLENKLWRAYREESPLGNLVADVLRGVTHADVGLTNGGGLREDLPAGPLRYGALFEALPFANKPATLTLSGAQLKQLLADNLRHDKGVLSIAGATVEARCSAGALTVAITLASGKPVGDGDAVRIGTTDFLALGGDDFGKLGPHAAPAIEEDAKPLRDLVADALKLRAHVSASDPAVYDPSHPRLRLPGRRPLRCAP